MLPIGFLASERLNNFHRLCETFEALNTFISSVFRAPRNNRKFLVLKIDAITTCLSAMCYWGEKFNRPINLVLGYKFGMFPPLICTVKLQLYAYASKCILYS